MSAALILSASIDRAGSASVMGAFGRVLGQAGGAALVASVFRLFSDAPSQAALYVAAGIALVAVAASLGRGMNRASGSA